MAGPTIITSDGEEDIICNVLTFGVISVAYLHPGPQMFFSFYQTIRKGKADVYLLVLPWKQEGMDKASAVSSATVTSIKPAVAKALPRNVETFTRLLPKVRM